MAGQKSFTWPELSPEIYLQTERNQKAANFNKSCAETDWENKNPEPYRSDKTENARDRCWFPKKNTTLGFDQNIVATRENKNKKIE